MIRNPAVSIVNGYDIHVVFSARQSKQANALFVAFLEFIHEKGIPHRRPKVFEKPVGPWTTPMWQVIVEQSNRVHHDLGECIAWFMLNRSGFSVMIHPNTATENNQGGAYEDHSQNMLWLGPPVALNLNVLLPKSSPVKASSGKA